MSILLKEITSYIEELAPNHLAEDWDNVGLLLGSSRQEVKKVMVCLDITDKVASEAVNQKVDLVLSHHPLVFKGLKKIQADDYKGRIIYKLIQNNISVYSAHTNMDVADHGINQILAEKFGLTKISNLNPYRNETLYKLAVFVPQDSFEAVRSSICEAGAGWMGNYRDCTFSSRGTGTFKPLEGSIPYIGSLENLEKVDEFRLETVVPKSRLKKVLDAMFKSHPYEEVAYDLFKMEQSAKEYGLGKVGYLKDPKAVKQFIDLIKKELGADHVRLIGSMDREIQKVAVFCGSFDGNWSGVKTHDADVLVTGDLKYHDATDALEMGLCVIDAGHFNTEAIVIPHLSQLLKNRFPELEVFASTLEENPFKIC